MKKPITERTLVAVAAAVGNHYIAMNEPIPFDARIMFKEPTRAHDHLQGTKPCPESAIASLFETIAGLDLAFPVRRLWEALVQGDEPGMEATRVTHIEAFLDLQRAKRLAFEDFIRTCLRAATGRTANSEELFLVELSVANMIERALSEQVKIEDTPTEGAQDVEST